MRICIDPGHGGSDPGAINSQTTEKAMNLIVGLELKKLLVLNGFTVFCTRETDIFIDLGPRCDLANRGNADLFVSIHHNAGGGDGYEVIHSIHHGVGKELADRIAAEFRALGQNAHGIGVYDKESTKNPGHDYLATIRDTNMPSVTTEYVFLDSMDYLAADTYEELLGEAKAIAKAICEEYGVIFMADEQKTATNDWAEQSYQELADAGLKFDEKRFDEPMTRGEAFAMLNKFRKTFLTNK